MSDVRPGPQESSLGAQRAAAEAGELELQEQVMQALARTVVTSAAPDELPLFGAMWRAYLDTPEAVLRRVVDRDEALGFGADVFSALTPFILAVSSTVVSFLLLQVTSVAHDAAEEEVQGLLRGWLARLTRSREDLPAPEPLSADQLARVRELAFEKARQLNLPEDQSLLLADAMVGSLASRR